MKLIMENWRKYLAEQEQKVGSGLLSNDPKQREFERLVSKDKEKWKSQAKERERQADWRTNVRALVLTLDPTGYVGDIDAKTGKVTPQYDLVKKAGNESTKAWNDGNYVEAALSAGDAALQAMAMIPVLGKIPKALSKVSKGIKTSQTISKNLKHSGEPKLIAKAKEIDNAIEKATQSRKAKKLNYNEQGVFTKHIKDNIPIPKDVAADIIKKNPDVAVRATNVYRGMRVNKEYILKHYGQEILSKGPGTHVLEVSKKFSPRKGTSSWAIDSSEAGAWAGGYT